MFLTSIYLLCVATGSIWPVPGDHPSLDFQWASHAMSSCRSWTLYRCIHRAVLIHILLVVSGVKLSTFSYFIWYFLLTSPSPIPILQILLPSPHSSQISADLHITHPTVETKSGSSFVVLNWVESVWGLVNSVAPSSLVKRIWAFGVAGFHHTPYFILVLGGST